MFLQINHLVVFDFVQRDEWFQTRDEEAVDHSAIGPNLIFTIFIACKMKENDFVWCKIYTFPMPLQTSKTFRLQGRYTNTLAITRLQSAHQTTLSLEYSPINGICSLRMVSKDTLEYTSYVESSVHSRE